MRHRKLLTAMAVGTLAFGSFGFNPGNGQGEGPPDDAQSDNACEGLEEAQDRVGEESPAQEVLQEVQAMLGADDCEESASEKKGGNGEDRP